MSRRLFKAACAALLCAALRPAACAGEAAPAGYNVIVIVVDALRADHLSLNGYYRRTSPNIDAFAGEAAVFRQAVSQAPTTLLSFASIFTSLNVSAHGVTGEERALGDTALTLAEIFRIYNYKTAAFLGGHNLHPVFRLDRGFDKYAHINRTAASFKDTLPPALAWAGGRSAKGEKFLLVVHGNDLHTPYAFPETRLYDKGFKVSPELKAMKPTDARVFGAYKRRLLLGPGKGVLALTGGDAAHLTARYDEGINYADALIGSFLAKLREKDLLDRSIVVITADHGEGLFDHDYFFHDFSLYDETLRVPLLIRAPGLGRREISRQVRLIDLMPTLLDLAGIPPAAQAQGRSLAPLLRGGAGGPEDYSLSEGPFGGKVIRSSRWKLIVSGEKTELYDLENDPGEKKNLAAAEKAKAEELKEELFRRLSEGADGAAPEHLRRGAAVRPAGAAEGAWQKELFDTLLNPAALEPAAP